MLPDDPEQILIAFGAWVRSGDPVRSVYFPSKSPTALMQPIRSNGVRLSDDEGKQVDDAMCALKAEDEFQYELLKTKYVYGHSLRWIARYGVNGHRLGKSRLSELHQQAKHFIVQQIKTPQKAPSRGRKKAAN